MSEPESIGKALPTSLDHLDARLRRQGGHLQEGHLAVRCTEGDPKEKPGIRDPLHLHQEEVPLSVGGGAKVAQGDQQLGVGDSIRR
jgi:hypothetical protein